MKKSEILSIFTFLTGVCLTGFCLMGPQDARCATVSELHITGAKTATPVLRRLIDSREGTEFDAQTWEADLRRLRNTEIFYDIRASTSDGPAGKVLRLELKNKFPTIPIFKFKQGGGTSHLTAGIYDVNLFNRYLEAGAQYERMNDKNGFVAWFRHPYLLSRKNRFGTEVYVHTINLPLLTLKGANEANFDNEEIRWNARLQRLWSETLRFTLEGSVYKNLFRADNSTFEKMVRNAAFQQRRPLREGHTVSITPSVTLGRLDRDEFYVTGQEATLEGEFADGIFGSDFNFIRGEITHVSGFRPARRVNLASNLRIGSKSGREFQHKFYLGGLDSARGFVDGQFRGEHMWQANLEARPTLIERPLWVLQGNVFTDLSKTWDSTNFGIDGFAQPFWSYGLGFRVILPRVYRAILRVDFARTHQPVRQFGMSLGLQQFF